MLDHLTQTMTPERITRHDDERLYQPRIHSRRIRELHRIAQETGEPMTVLVDQAIADFVEAYPYSTPGAQEGPLSEPNPGQDEPSLT